MLRMTDEQKRADRGLLLLEYQEALDNLAQLYERALRLAEPLDELVGWLKNARYAGAERIPMHAQVQGRARFLEAQVRDKPEEYSCAVAEALTIIEEIRQARDRIADLAERKQALGLK